MDATSHSYYHCNRYSAESACEFCTGIIRHADWCITRCDAVRYAYEAFLDASKLSESDSLILHALGVKWQDFKPCTGNCGISQGDSTNQINLV
jgi:hypothetical protein